MVCAAEPTGPSHLLPKTAQCRTTAFGAELARCRACSGQEEARQISTHVSSPPPALRGRTADRRAISMRRAFRSRRRARSHGSLVRSHRTARTTHRRSTRCAYNTVYGIQCVRSSSFRAPFLSVLDFNSAERAKAFVQTAVQDVTNNPPARQAYGVYSPALHPRLSSAQATVSC
jgi:hypothetical protein